MFNKYLVSLLFVLFSSLGVAQVDTTKALEQLDVIITNLHRAKHYVEKHDQGRVLILEKVVQKTRNTVSEKGVGHMEAVRCYQEMIIAFKYSDDFFNKIQTQVSSAKIARIRTLANQISVEKGLNDSPYTKITESIYSQILVLIDELIELPIGLRLKEKMMRIRPEIGNLLALARLGDRPRTFSAADDVHEKIDSIADDISDLILNDEVLNIFVGITTLNEFYSKFAQLGE